MKKILKDYEIFIIPIFVVIVIAFGIFTLIRNFNGNKNVISVDYLNYQNVLINNSLPMTDVIGKNINLDNYKNGVTGYLEFEVKSLVNNKVKYDIYLTKEDLENEIPVKFIKVYLTDENDNVLNEFKHASVLTYYDLKDSLDENGKLLYSGFLKDKQSKKFKLRMWVADTYELTTDERQFSVKLNVKKK